MAHHEPVIYATNLFKNFGPVRALDNLNLNIAPGEVHGYLGPNGAGEICHHARALRAAKARCGHGAGLR